MPQPVNVLIIYSNYYEEITDGLMSGAAATLQQAGVNFDKVEVPGVLEIPAALSMAVEQGHYDAFVLLGCVIRGETTHYDIVAIQSARAIMDIMCANKLALGNGIQTVENLKQARTRANPNEKNKGGGAAAAALEMINVKNRLGG